MLAPACLPGLSAVAHAIDAVLPQTQCGRCGYDGCAPYAQAVTEGEAINRCPPGGEEGVVRIAAIVGRPAIPLDPTLGRPGPLLVAHIDEARCIGCTLCLQACPVDAIVGGAKRMHAVVSTLCTGCELCVAPCPVDCIEMRPAGRAWSTADADAARGRHAARSARGASTAPEDAATSTPEHAGTPRPDPASDQAVLSEGERRDAIANAIARARARRQKASVAPRPPDAQE